MAHDVDAIAIGDGVSFAPHRVLDVNASGLDFYLFSTYKTFGTHLGAMWGRPEILDTIEPQGHYFNRDIPHYNFNPAGPLHAQIGALAGLREYIETLYGHHFDEAQPGFHARAAKAFELFADHETNQAHRILKAVKAIHGSIVIGQDQALTGSRAPTISITLAGMSSGEAVEKLVKRDISIRNGHGYARRCIEALGIKDPEDGVIRISLVHYNNEDDVSRLVEALGELA